MSLRWEGDNVRARVLLASRLGINKTMAECVPLAKATHPFTNRTGMAERSIQIAQGAQTSGDISFGLWGSKIVKYFKYLELGTKLTKSRTSISQRARIMRTGIFKRPKNAGAPPWNGGSWGPTLRPVAAEVYPKLKGYIREQLARIK